MTGDRRWLTAGDTRLCIAPTDGGRVAAWHVGAHQLLRSQSAGLGPEEWGCYPMVPWAGRIRDATFVWREKTVRLPHPTERHALHGVAHRMPWQVIDETPDRVRLSLELPRDTDGAGWQFGGHVQQQITVAPNQMEVRLRVTAAEDDMPLTVGWHPWFVRQLAGSEAEVRLDASRMMERGTDGLPTHRWTRPSAGPWDDCVTDLGRPPTVVWPDVGTVTIHSDLEYVVVFDQHPAGVCVEPQSGPPDAVNGPTPHVLAAGESLICRMRLLWEHASS